MNRYWCDDNGALTCEDHAGSYLRASISASPRKRTHRTPLGTWELLTADEVAEMQTLFDEWGITGRTEVCEMCDHEVRG